MIPRLLAAAITLLGAGAAFTQDPRPATDEAPESTDGFGDVFPFIRVDREAGFVELEGIVPIDAHDEDAPHVYLELIVCSPDTREHESLVMTHARPSHVHAALLLIGLEPGSPGTWRYAEDDAVERVPPSGSEVTVELVIPDENAEAGERISRAESWIRHAVTDEAFTERFPGATWVFGGSRLGTTGEANAQAYRADASGNIITLATFGDGVIGFSEVISDQAAIDTPIWIADRAVVPEQGTAVMVRLRAPHDDAPQDELAEEPIEPSEPH